MKLWLDDLCENEFVEICGELISNDRYTPEGYIGVKTVREAIKLIKTGKVEYISFDHDLGASESGVEIHGNGYVVAKYIEKYAFLGTCGKIGWDVHSSNPVGRANIEAAMISAERRWIAVKL